jgi:hypothetical protein
MPLDENILGFSNTWYRPAMDHAEERELEEGLEDSIGRAGIFLRFEALSFCRQGQE